MNNQLLQNLQRVRNENEKRNRKGKINANNTKNTGLGRFLFGINRKNTKKNLNKITKNEKKSLNDIPDNTKEELFKILNRRKNIDNLHKLKQTSRSFKKVANEAKNLKEYEYYKYI